MIARFFARLLGKKNKQPPRSKRIAVRDHGISRDHITQCALKVTDTLQQHGYQAFVVGGAVRDLLLARIPKDFDVATNATPEQVHALFRRSHIIGRRFRLVHVMCGNDTIEVSTFRASAQHEHHAQASDASGRLVRDNVFGSHESDANRRDFTINALYFDPSKEEIWDYCNGMEDIRQKTLRIIGDAATRYREDPVRMLRAARFAAKLDFTIDAQARAPIAELADLLKNVPSSRLFDETLKLLLSGHAVRAIEQLQNEGLQHSILPVLSPLLEHETNRQFIFAALRNTDERIQSQKPVSPAFLFATLLWHPLRVQHQKRLTAGEDNYPAWHTAMQDVLEQERPDMAIPRRLDGTIKEIWGLQTRFEQRNGDRAWRLLAQPRFRAAYDFLLLRAETGEVTPELADWWTRFQHAPDDERQTMVTALAPAANPKKRRRKKTTAQTGVEAAQETPNPTMEAEPNG